MRETKEESERERQQREDLEKEGALAREERHFTGGQGRSAASEAAKPEAEAPTGSGEDGAGGKASKPSSEEQEEEGGSGRRRRGGGQGSGGNAPKGRGGNAPGGPSDPGSSSSSSESEEESGEDGEESERSDEEEEEGTSDEADDEEEEAAAPPDGRRGRERTAGRRAAADAADPANGRRTDADLSPNRRGRIDQAPADGRARDRISQPSTSERAPSPDDVILLYDRKRRDRDPRATVGARSPLESCATQARRGYERGYADRHPEDPDAWGRAEYWADPWYGHGEYDRYGHRVARRSHGYDPRLGYPGPNPDFRAGPRPLFGDTAGPGPMSQQDPGIGRTRGLPFGAPFGLRNPERNWEGQRWLYGERIRQATTNLGGETDPLRRAEIGADIQRLRESLDEVTDRIVGGRARNGNGPGDAAGRLGVPLGDGPGPGRAGPPAGRPRDGSPGRPRPPGSTDPARGRSDPELPRRHRGGYEEPAGVAPRLGGWVPRALSYSTAPGEVRAPQEDPPEEAAWAWTWDQWDQWADPTDQDELVREGERIEMYGFREPGLRQKQSFSGKLPQLTAEAWIEFKNQFRREWNANRWTAFDAKTQFLSALSKGAPGRRLAHISNEGNVPWRAFVQWIQRSLGVLLNPLKALAMYEKASMKSEESFFDWHGRLCNLWVTAHPGRSLREREHDPGLVHRFVSKLHTTHEALAQYLMCKLGDRTIQTMSSALTHCEDTAAVMETRPSHLRPAGTVHALGTANAAGANGGHGSGRSGASGAPRTPSLCFNCEQPGHRIADCPQPLTEAGRNRQRAIRKRPRGGANHGAQKKINHVAVAPKTERNAPPSAGNA